METTNRRPLIIGIIASGILLIPLVAMQFSSEVRWNIMDFVIAGAMLFGTGVFLELVLRSLKQKKNRIAAAVAILLGLVLLWAEMAVGIFGSPLAGS